MQKVISNSSPLIHLSKISRLNLLKDFFNEVIVPEAVYKECVVEGGDRDDARKIAKAKWIRVLKIRDEKLKRAFMMGLDEGEAEAIVLALEESADLILLDDYEARRVARSFGLSVTGTVGILVRAKREGKVECLEDEIEKLMKTGFWLNRELYERILAESREL
ncbi:DUF3368 domain-containing protein [Geoglobus acetivorans]|uniref:DUF3368 domain-containing protein n=1 Tax=Geoglobus acetivorans TaxID=565033 RepID=UPI00064EF765